MSNSPFFTIIIPTYNRATLIARTLDTAINQTFTDYEIIVIDDGSTDNTAEVVKSINSTKLSYHKKKNEERSIARNTGIKLAKGKYVTFLDSDDLLFPNYLQYAFETLQKNNLPAFLNCSYQFVDSKGKIIWKQVYKRIDIKVLIIGNPFSCIGNFVRKDILEEYKFNEDSDLITSEDWELWIRIAARYNYVIDSRITSCLVDHSNRSVRNFDVERLIKHKHVALKSAMKDPYVQKHFNHRIKRIEAFIDTYISLHLALTGHKFLTIKYLFTGFIKYPPCIFYRRFLAIIKHLIISW